MPMFERYIGIDYSGAEERTSRLCAIQVFTTSSPDEDAAPLDGMCDNGWSREALTKRLIELLGEEQTCTLIGIDHGFSFPREYLQKRLNDLSNTQGRELWKNILSHKPRPDDGEYHLKRITDTCAPNARPVLSKAYKGQVGTATHEGIKELSGILESPAAKHTHF